MEASLLANLRERDRTEELPQRSAIGELELASLSSAKERAASRLHDVFRTDASAQGRVQLAGSNAFQGFAVRITKLTAGVLIPGT